MRFTTGLLLITLCAVLLFSYWATRPMRMLPQGVTSGATPYEQDLNLITNCYPAHLVSPRWLPAQNLIGSWVSYEVLVRTAVLFVLWFFAVVYLHIRIVRSTSHSGVPKPVHPIA